MSKLSSRLKGIRAWMFTVPEGIRESDDIVKWWEQRRLAYNLIVGVIGFISLILFGLFISAADELKPGDDAVDPMALFIAPFIINACYTLGWMVEIALQSRRFPESDRTLDPRLLKLGLSFSLAIIVFPSLFWGIINVLQNLGTRGK